MEPKKKLTAKQETFVREMIKGTEQAEAYRIAYPNSSPAAARTSSYTLLQNPTISAAIKEGAAKIHAIATQEIVQEAKEELRATLLTTVRKREILALIAEGNILIEKKIPMFNPLAGGIEVITISEAPDARERMKAIEIDNKMTGDNEPEESELEIRVVYGKKTHASHG